jgi:5-(carboxyamino)imidazole ribonucleotide synthase
LAVYEPIYNEHANHILDVSTSPSGIPAAATKQALEIAHAVATAFELVGLICIEFFLTHSGEVLVNEIAPRPHNSGHLTIEAHATSQFEQQLRAICGLPLGSTRQIRHAAMANLLGDLWKNGTPRWEAVSHVPEAYLHLYDKEQPKPGRKMGHLTVCAESSTAAARLARVLRQQLCRE